MVSCNTCSWCYAFLALCLWFGDARWLSEPGSKHPSQVTLCGRALYMNCLILFLHVILAFGEWVLISNVQQNVCKQWCWTYLKVATKIKLPREMEKSMFYDSSSLFQGNDHRKEKKNLQAIRDWWKCFDLTIIRIYCSWCQHVASKNLKKIRIDFQCAMPGPCSLRGCANPVLSDISSIPSKNTCHIP